MNGHCCFFSIYMEPEQFTASLAIATNLIN